MAYAPHVHKQARARTHTPDSHTLTHVNACAQLTGFGHERDCSNTEYGKLQITHAVEYTIADLGYTC